MILMKPCIICNQLKKCVAPSGGDFRDVKSNKEQKYQTFETHNQLVIKLCASLLRLEYVFLVLGSDCYFVAQQFTHTLISSSVCIIIATL